MTDNTRSNPMANIDYVNMTPTMIELIKHEYMASRESEIYRLHAKIADLKAERERLRLALSAMVTFFGMDEDSASKMVFDVARAALAAAKEQRHER